MIKGKVSGITMIGDQIHIRGISSIRNSSGALIIVDGMPTDINSLKGIPVYSVKSINVLKGAEASIYGSRGSNGVIIIKLKTE